MKVRKINYTKSLILALITTMVLIFICVVAFIVIFAQSFYEALTLGLPVESEYVLSNEVKDYYSRHCKVERDDLIISYPNQIPRHGFNFYNTRSGGYFYELIKTNIEYKGKKESLDIKFKIHTSEDNVIIEEVNGQPSDSLKCY